MKIDSFVSRLSRRYPRVATVYAARAQVAPILDFARNEKAKLRLS
jgi:hypothetical protein